MTTSNSVAVIETAKPVKTAAKKIPTTKVADKVATKKAPAAKKATASKAAPKSSKGIAFSIMAGHRPGSGGHLFAHTQAVFELTGMDKGKAADKALLVKVMGETAVRYNIKESKFAVIEGGKIELTAGGKLALIEGRKGKIDTALVEAYKGILSTGAPSELVRLTKSEMFVKVA